MKTEQHAYRLAPWRKQLKSIINILLVLVLGACIASVYLNYSAQMTDMKLQIQILHDQRNELTRTIADYVTREGILTSYALMEKKATQAGYIKIDFDDEDIYTYLPIPGYIPDIDILSERSVQLPPLPVSPLKPEYTESLQQYIFQKLPTKESEK